MHTRGAMEKEERGVVVVFRGLAGVCVNQKPDRTDGKSRERCDVSCCIKGVVFEIKTPVIFGHFGHFDYSYF